MTLSELPPHPKARVISNPTAGGARRSPLRQAVGALADCGWQVSWRETEAANHARRLAAEAAEQGYDIVVAAGGDGTINEIVNGLVGSPTALAVLPAGTGNVFAAQLGLLGIPTPLHRADLPAAAMALASGVPRWIDTGYARPRGHAGRHFVMVAGVGMDAEVTKAVEGPARELKRAFGPAVFGALGLKALLETAGTPALVRIDGARIRAPLLLGIVSNIRLYGGTVALTPDAVMDDGALDVELFCGDGPLSSVAHLGSVLAGRRDDPARRSATARRIRFCASTPLPIHLDGEPFATTPVTFTVQPRSLRLVVPREAPTELFETAAPTGRLSATGAGR